MIPPVVASERGRAQTGGLAPRGCGTGIRPFGDKCKPLGSGAAAGDSPLHMIPLAAFRHPSRAGHVKPRLNPEGPPSKAKYYLSTDSAPVP